MTTCWSTLLRVPPRVFLTGLETKLTGLRVQNRVMLKGAAGCHASRGADIAGKFKRIERTGWREDFLR